MDSVIDKFELKPLVSKIWKKVLGTDLKVFAGLFFVASVIAGIRYHKWALRKFYQIPKLHDAALEEVVQLWHKTTKASGRPGMTLMNLQSLPQELKAEFAWNAFASITFIQNITSNRQMAQNMKDKAQTPSALVKTNMLFAIMRRAVRGKLNFLNADTIDALRHAKPRELLLFSADMAEMALTAPVTTWLKEFKRVRTTYHSAQLFSEAEAMEIMGSIRQRYCACIFFLYAASHMDARDFEADIHDLDDFLISRALPTRYVADMTPKNFEEAMTEFFDATKNTEPIKIDTWFEFTQDIVSHISKQVVNMFDGHPDDGDDDDEKDEKDNLDI